MTKRKALPVYEETGPAHRAQARKLCVHLSPDNAHDILIRLQSRRMRGDFLYELQWALYDRIPRTETPPEPKTPLRVITGGKS